MSRYGIAKKLSCGYDEAVGKTRAAMDREGLKLLSEINISENLKSATSKEFRKYLILGAYDPPLVHKALMIENDLGLFLPSNIIVYENDEGGCTVAGTDPLIAMSMIENPAIALVAREIREKMERTINSIN